MVNQSTSFPSGLRHPMFDWDKQQTDSRATTKIRVFLSYISCNIIKWILISQIYGNWVRVINSLNALGLCPLKLHLGMGFRNNRKILLFPPVFCISVQIAETNIVVVKSVDPFGLVWTLCPPNSISNYDLLGVSNCIMISTVGWVRFGASKGLNDNRRLNKICNSFSKNISSFISILIDGPQ